MKNTIYLVFKRNQVQKHDGDLGITLDYADVFGTYQEAESYINDRLVEQHDYIMNWLTTENQTDQGLVDRTIQEAKNILLNKYLFDDTAYGYDEDEDTWIIEKNSEFYEIYTILEKTL